MMRQTAAFQISVDFDDEPWLRWRVLNAAAPYVVAIFANSPIYAGEPTGHQSTRADVWRNLDPVRTGIPSTRPLLSRRISSLPWLPRPSCFRCWTGNTGLSGSGSTDANPTADDWQEHLSTLFPEVRPRGHLELRSADAIAPEWYAAPIALTAGILYDSRALRAAADLLPVPELGLLERAGRLGLHDPAIAEPLPTSSIWR